MTAKEIFFKTLQFGWIKLGLGLLNILIAVLLFAILMGISVLFLYLIHISEPTRPY